MICLLEVRLEHLNIQISCLDLIRVHFALKIKVVISCTETMKLLDGKANDGFCRNAIKEFTGTKTQCGTIKR